MPRLRRRWLPWVLVAVVAVLWAAIALALFPLISDEVRSATVGHRVVVQDDRAAFGLRVPGDVAITTIGTAHSESGTNCERPYYLLSGAGERSLEVMIELVPTDCRIPPRGSQQIGNGRHGVYRSISDVQDPQQVTKIQTGVGTATVFTQRYYECTNHCTDYSEPVAIIPLSDPVSQKYPIMVVRGYGDDLKRSDLDKIVGSLRRGE